MPCHHTLKTSRKIELKGKANWVQSNFEIYVYKLKSLQEM